MHGAHLEESDLYAVLDLIEAIAATSSTEDYVNVTMKGMYELISCVDVSYNEAVPSEGRIAWTALPDQGERMAEFAPLFERLMRQNPLIKHFEDTGDTRAMKWSDFVTIEQFQKTSLYKDMFGPLGISSQMAVTLPTPPGDRCWLRHEYRRARVR